MTFNYISIPLIDTGLGQELGFESDEAFLEHMDAERRKLPHDVQTALADLEREMARRFFFGD